MRRFSSDMRPSAVLMGMQSWQRVSPQGWREYSQYWIAPASMPSAMSHKSASLSLSAILLARSTVLEKAASKVSAMGSMGRSIGTRPLARKAPISSGECTWTAYVQRTALFEPNGVDTQAARAGFFTAKQRDVRDMRHVHEPLSRPVPDVFQRNPQSAPLPGRQIVAAIETVAEIEIVATVVHAYAEMKWLVGGILHVDDQRPVVAPVRHR